MAFTVSLPFDRRLWRDDIAGSRAHVGGLARAGLLDPAERDAVLAALDTVEDELAADTFAFVGERRGHPHRDRAAGHRARRPGRGQAAHRPQPQRPGGHRPAAVVQARAARRRPADRRSAGRPARAGRSRPVTTTCPATPTCSAPSRCCSPTTCSPTAGRSPATWSACSPPSSDSTCPRSAPAPWPGPRSRSIPAATADALGFARVFDNSLDAVSDRDFVAEALFDLALARRPPLPARRGVGAVDERRVRVRPARRRLRDRIVDAAAEEEPRRRRARPRQGRSPDRQPDRAAGDAEGPAARLQPGPAGGQGAAVRLGRPGLPRTRRADRDDRDRRARAGADGRGSRRRDDARRPTSPSGSSVEGHRFARLTPSSATWSGATWPPGRRWPSWWRPTTGSVRAAAELVGPGAPCGGGRRRAGPGPTPWPSQIERFGETLRRQRDKLSDDRDGLPAAGSGALRRVRHAGCHVQRPLPRLLRRRGRHVGPPGAARAGLRRQRRGDVRLHDQGRRRSPGTAGCGSARSPTSTAR